MPHNLQTSEFVRALLCREYTAEQLHGIVEIIDYLFESPDAAKGPSYVAISVKVEILKHLQKQFNFEPS